MSKNDFSPITLNFKEIIDSPKKYVVPLYQRDYSWSKEEWSLLLDDIKKSSDQEHYMGIIVLQEKEDNNDEYDLIDGQQRFATISLMILACLKIINDKVEKDKTPENEKKLRNLINKYIGREDDDGKYYNKIILNQNNNSFYAELCNFKNAKTDPKGKWKINKEISNCLDFFYTEFIKEMGQSTIEEISKFINHKIVNKLWFTEIIVKSEINAFKLFETLNSRAVSLTSFDLLKNHLLQIVGAKKNKSMIDDINQIYARVERLKMSKFIYLEWNSTNDSKVVETRIYRQIANTITNSKQAFEYVKNLKVTAKFYEQIENGDLKINKESLEYLKIIKYMKISQYLMILFAYSLSDKTKYNLNKIIKMIFLTSMRYNYINQGQANIQEKLYNKIAYKIYTNSYKDDKGIFNEIKNSELNISKDKFISAFCEKFFKNEKVDRYIFAEIAKYRDEIYPHYDILSIEHIDDQKEKNKTCYMFGNQTLLDKDLNGSLSGKTFAEKKVIYAKNSSSIVTEINENQWTYNEIENRTKKLAEEVEEIFKYEY